MLEVYRSNKLEVLVGILTAQLDAPDAMPADPFAPLRLVVGSKGMERWLRHQLASRLPGRICANVDFPFPSQVLTQALHALEGAEDQPADPWEIEALRWAVLEVLPGLLDRDARPELAPLRAYLDEGVSGPVSPRALALAGQLADIFDRLVTYRPQLAVDWSMGGVQLPAAATDLGWLPLLWQAVHRHLLGGPARGAHRAQRWHTLMRSGPPSAWPFDQPLRIFGIASLPPSFLQQLAWLARAPGAMAELYLVGPSDAYWADLHRLGHGAIDELLACDRDKLGDRIGVLQPEGLHPLLQSLGRVARDMQLVVEGLGEGVVDRGQSATFVDLAPQLADPQRREGSQRALHVLQSDMAHLRDPMGFGPAQRQARPLAPGDDSLQLHACYGPTRQVEVLRDALLHLFEDHPDLEPRDVLVMVPDIEAYVPHIGAVFDQGRERPVERHGVPVANPAERWGPAGAPHIPYAVTERSIRRTNPVAEVLLRVLQLASGQVRISSVAVLDLLAVEPFRQRFGIAHEEIETIAGWVEQSGIRWGIDPQDRQGFEQPATAQNTWRFGLERLALGVTMADAPGRLWDRPARLEQPSVERALGVAPHDALEGGVVHLLGRFLDACSTLFDEIGRLRGARAVGAWLRLIAGDPELPSDSVAGMGTLGRLTATTPAAAWLTARVRAELEGLRAAVQLAGAQRPLDIDAFHALLSGRFEVASGATRAHTGAVTFAAMAPYRSVPYRVICLLGMDEGAFPRPAGSRRFDPTQLAPRAGDRDPRDEDRHLLLEALLAARDHLLILYTGRDPRSNERRAPAVPVAELLEVVDATFQAPDQRPPRQHITREHPLQAFSLDCFDPRQGGRPWSYDHGLLEGARAAMNQERSSPRFFEPGAQPPASTEPTADAPREVELAALEWFLRNPTKALLSRGLGLYLPRDEEPIPHREPIQPDGLDRWGWLTALIDDRWSRLHARIEGTERLELGLADPLERLRAEGRLPLGAGGDRWLRVPALAAEQVMDAASAWFGDEQRPHRPQRLPFDLALEVDGQPVRLLGGSGPIWQGDQLVLGVGDILGKGKYRLGPWLRHLAWVASTDRPDARTVLIHGRIDGRGRPEVQVASMRLVLRDGLVELVGVSPAQRARAILCELLRLYLQGLERPLPLFEQASYEFVRRAHYYNTVRFGPRELLPDAPEPEESVLGHIRAAQDKARQSFGLEGGPSSYSSRDLDDAYVARVWAGLDPVTDPQAPWAPLQRDFAMAALALWQPLFQGWAKHGTKTPIAPRDLDDGGEP